MEIGGWSHRTLEYSPTTLKEVERLKTARSLSLLEAGCPHSSWSTPGLYGPPLHGAQTDPCALQVLSFIGLLPASVFPGCSSSFLLHDRWGWQSHIPRAEGNTVASEAMRGRKNGSNVQGQSDLCRGQWVDSVYPAPSSTVPHTSNLGCRRAGFNGLLYPKSFSFS